MAEEPKMGASEQGAKDRKFGEGHASAMVRQGLNELRGSLYTGSNVAQQLDLGVYGNATQGEIADARRPAKSRDLYGATKDSPLQQSMEKAERARQERPEPGMEMER